MLKKYCGFLNIVIDGVLNMGRKLKPEKYCGPAEGWASAIYSVLMYLIGIVFFLRSIVYAIKVESFDLIWIGLGVLIGSVLFAYIGDKILSTTRGLYSKTVSKLRSPAILDCIALLYVLLAIGALVLGIKSGMGFTGIIVGICGLILFLLVAVTALCPKMLAIEIDENCSAGEELVGLLTFFTKNLLFVLPFCLCFGSIAMLWSLLFQLGIAAEYAFIMMAMLPVIIGIGLLPLIVYLIYLAYYFVLDICRAILSIPEKLDKLNK